MGFFRGVKMRKLNNLKVANSPPLTLRVCDMTLIERKSQHTPTIFIIVAHAELANVSSVERRFSVVAMRHG